MVTDNYIFKLNVMTWGWIHLIAGVILLLAGFGLFSDVANLLFLPYYPLWSLLIIAVDIAVI